MEKYKFVPMLGGILKNDDVIKDIEMKHMIVKAVNNLILKNVGMFSKETELIQTLIGFVDKIIENNKLAENEEKLGLSALFVFKTAFYLS